MIFKDIGLIGTGVWQAPAIGNERYAREPADGLAVKDPYRGRRGDDGQVRIAGLTLDPARHPRSLAAIERSFTDPFRGTRRRRFFPRELPVSSAEADAGRRALDDAGLSSADVDAVLVQSFLADEIQPENNALVAHKLGIRHAPAWEVDSICNSTVTHMTVAASLIQSGFARRVLCVQSCAYSRVSDPGSSSSIQEADLATAFVLGPKPGSSMAFAWRTDGRLHASSKLRWQPSVSAAPRRWWEPSREELLIAFDLELQGQLMGEIADHALVVCDEALGRAELTRADIELLVCHQPMSWFPPFLEELLGLPAGVVLDTFEEYANVNSAAVTASLDEARRRGRLGPGARALVFAPGAGYTYGAVVIQEGGR